MAQILKFLQVETFKNTFNVMFMSLLLILLKTFVIFVLVDWERPISLNLTLSKCYRILKTWSAS